MFTQDCHADNRVIKDDHPEERQQVGEVFARLHDATSLNSDSAVLDACLQGK